MTFGVIVATHGDVGWQHLASRRAVPSAVGQTDEVIVFHDTDLTLAQARNTAASRAWSDYLVFLDADDELSPGYIEAMKTAVAHKQSKLIPWLLIPRVQSVHDTVAAPPWFPNRHAPMEELNWGVIGTGVPRKLLMDVGWFREWPCYEDWELWLRCMRAGGAVLRDVPDAIYRAYVRPDSRNQASADVRQETYQQIRLEHSLAATQERTAPGERAASYESSVQEERAGDYESTDVDERAIEHESTGDVER